MGADGEQEGGGTGVEGERLYTLGCQMCYFDCGDVLKGVFLKRTVLLDSLDMWGFLNIDYTQ